MKKVDYLNKLYEISEEYKEKTEEYEEKTLRLKTFIGLLISLLIFLLFIIVILCSSYMAEATEYIYDTHANVTHISYLIATINPDLFNGVTTFRFTDKSYVEEYPFDNDSNVGAMLFWTPYNKKHIVVYNTKELNDTIIMLDIYHELRHNWQSRYFHMNRNNQTLEEDAERFSQEAIRNNE